MSPRKPRETKPKKIADSGSDFSKLVLQVPVDVFVKMVSKSGIPTPQARELCLVFKDMKG